MAAILFESKDNKLPDPLLLDSENKKCASVRKNILDRIFAVDNDTPDIVRNKIHFDIIKTMICGGDIVVEQKIYTASPLINHKWSLELRHNFDDCFIRAYLFSFDDILLMLMKKLTKDKMFDSYIFDGLLENCILAESMKDTYNNHGCDLYDSDNSLKTYLLTQCCYKLIKILIDGDMDIIYSKQLFDCIISKITNYCYNILCYTYDPFCNLIYDILSIDKKDCVDVIGVIDNVYGKFSHYLDTLTLEYLINKFFNDKNKSVTEKKSILTSLIKYLTEAEKEMALPICAMACISHELVTIFDYVIEEHKVDVIEYHGTSLVTEVYDYGNYDMLTHVIKKYIANDEHNINNVIKFIFKKVMTNKSMVLNIFYHMIQCGLDMRLIGDIYIENYLMFLRDNIFVEDDAKNKDQISKYKEYIANSHNMRLFAIDGDTHADVRNLIRKVIAAYNTKLAISTV